MRKISFGTPVVDPPRPVRSVDHWSEIAPMERTLNVVPVAVPGIDGVTRYAVTSGHWLDLLTSLPENRIAVTDEHAVLAVCTTHEATLAAFRLLNGAL